MRSCQYVIASSTGQVLTGPCFLIGVIFHDTGANTFNVYDATSATNLVLKAQIAAAGNQVFMFTEPIAFKTGIYYGVTGATNTATFLVA